MGTIVITGATSGLGAELARIYARAGASLALTGRSSDRLQAITAECRRLGASVQSAVADVREAAGLSSWLRDVDAATPVEAVVCSAGISGSVSPGAAAEPPDLARRQIETNLLGVMNTVEPLLPALIERRRGRIGVISSVAGLRGLPYSPAYSASKAGVRAYGEGLRPLLAPHGVSVTVATLGFFDTPMTERWQGSTPFLRSAPAMARAVAAAIDKGRPRLTTPWPLGLALRVADLGPPAVVDPILRGFRFHILPPA